MPNLLVFSPATYSLQKRYFFSIFKGFKTTSILMECQDPIIETDQLPKTFEILNKMLPSIFKSKCYNDKNLPFFIEVRSTEIGHLFEHIMLEYICQIKIARGLKKASISGVTDWNWRKDLIGTFHITIRTGREDYEIFIEALKRSIELLEIIVNQNMIFQEKQMAA